MADDKAELKNRVRRILLESQFAMLATVGEDSRPFARWMSPIFATGSIKEFHCLAAPDSRKLVQLANNPRVSWVFSSPGFAEIVTIHGTASVDDDPILRSNIWERMPEKGRAFILKNDANLQFAILRTEVERIEYCRATEGQTTPTIMQP